MAKVKKKRKKDKIAFHEYMIFAGGGLIALFAAVFSAFYSVESNGSLGENYTINIRLDSTDYEGLILNSDLGKSLSKLLPISETALPNPSGVHVPAVIPIVKTEPEYMKAEPGEILYDPSSLNIILVSGKHPVLGKYLRLGKLINAPEEFPLFGSNVPVYLKLKD